MYRISEAEMAEPYFEAYKPQKVGAGTTARRNDVRVQRDGEEAHVERDSHRRAVGRVDPDERTIRIGVGEICVVHLGLVNAVLADAEEESVRVVAPHRTDAIHQ